MASARRRGPLRPSLRLMPTMAMEAMVGMASAMGVMDTVMARGLLMQRLMLTSAMVGPTPATDMGTARGLLTLRLTHTMVMEDMDLDMALAMEATAMVVLVMARGLLTLRLTHTMIMEDMVDM